MSQLIIALDTPDFATAVRWIELTRGDCRIYKIGRLFFYSQGMRGLLRLFARFPDLEYMFDTKLYDTPDTLRELVPLLPNTVKFVTVAVQTGVDSMRALRIKSYGPKFVPVLSLSNEALVIEEIDRRIKLAETAAMQGAVCTGDIAQKVQKKLGGPIIGVGLRRSVDQHDNHQIDRVTTLKTAHQLRHTVDFWVCGRPIIKADNPGLAARQIRQAIA